MQIVLVSGAIDAKAVVTGVVALAWPVDDVPDLGASETARGTEALPSGLRPWGVLGTPAVNLAVVR